MGVGRGGRGVRLRGGCRISEREKVNAKNRGRGGGGGGPDIMLSHKTSCFHKNNRNVFFTLSMESTEGTVLNPGTTICIRHYNLLLIGARFIYTISESHSKNVYIGQNVKIRWLQPPFSVCWPTCMGGDIYIAVECCSILAAASSCEYFDVFP